MKRIGRSNAWQGAVGRIKWVMDSRSSLTRCVPFSILLTSLFCLIPYSYGASSCPRYKLAPFMSITAASVHSYASLRIARRHVPGVTLRVDFLHFVALSCTVFKHARTDSLNLIKKFPSVLFSSSLPTRPCVCLCTPHYDLNDKTLTQAAGTPCHRFLVNRRPSPLFSLALIISILHEAPGTALSRTPFWVITLSSDRIPSGSWRSCASVAA
jgi:hypothetical protein